MSTQFKARGYSDTCITKAADRNRRQQRTAALKYKPKSNTYRVPFVITHNPMNPPLRADFTRDRPRPISNLYHE